MPYLCLLSGFNLTSFHLQALPSVPSIFRSYPHILTFSGLTLTSFIIILSFPSLFFRPYPHLLPFSGLTLHTFIFRPYPHLHHLPSSRIPSHPSLLSSSGLTLTFIFRLTLTSFHIHTLQLSFFNLHAGLILTSFHFQGLPSPSSPPFTIRP
jgi:hypothetical protein